MNAAAQEGVELLGRWDVSKGTQVASYGGSAVLFKFKNSSWLKADLTAGRTTPGDAPGIKLYIRISVDGGAPHRIPLHEGMNPAFEIASGLSSGTHLVELRYDHEPEFGSLQIGNPALDTGGVWQKISDTRPIIEVIDDSDATGVCVLGPQSPATPAPLHTAAWSSQILSWPALLESELAVLGHPAIVVDLALSGSNTETEATTYNLAAPKWSDSAFDRYSGNRRVSLALLWGGSNDRNMGGEVATGSPVTYANLSPFERGIYDQITEIASHNPGVKLGLLQYVDPRVPDWKPAYLQVKSLLPEETQKQIFFFAVKDVPMRFAACDVDPVGHPNLGMHASWAAQILQWMISENLLPPASADPQ